MNWINRFNLIINHEPKLLFPLYRYNPEAEKPFTWDAKEPTGNYEDFIKSEGRYKSLVKTNPEHAEELYTKAAEDAKNRMAQYKAIGEIL